MRSKANLASANLVAAHLTSANLLWANLSGATLESAELAGANLFEANLIEPNLSKANLTAADLRRSDLSRANLSESNLNGANLFEAILRGANLSGADLQGANLSKTELRGANLSNCRVYGVSAWNVATDGEIQSNLIITENNEPAITVDNLEVAQFIYLLIHNQKLRDVIDTIGKKAVLILGCFTPERKAVLDALRNELRKWNYILILFDFEKLDNRDLAETISTLAHLSRFIITEITAVQSIREELQAIVPNLPSVVVHPIIHEGDYEYAMFEHAKRYPWVLPVYQYESQELLIAALPDIVQAAEKKVMELRPNS